LVDCGGSPLYKLARFGIELTQVRAVILTHRHADHMYGLPMLVQGLWLGGREAPLQVCGPAQTLAAARELLALYGLAEREGMYRLEWNPVPLRTGRRVLDIDQVQISAAPVVHGDVDTIALRFDNSATGRAVVYSSDTEPCPALVQLAAGANLMIHEATGEHAGHSSPAQAAEVAREAGAEHLILIHYPVQGIDLEGWRRQAAEFPGTVALAQDGDIYPL
jgi:ribonuclease Z